ncbi:MAG: MFS transporter [Roseibium sp.]
MNIFSRLPRQGVLIFFLLLTNSICGAAIIPMMSFFIVEGLGVEPWKIGIYTGAVLTLTLLTNRWAGERIDHGFPVRKLLLISISAYIAGTSFLTQTDSFLTLVAIFAPLMSLSNMGSGTIFTFGRLYAQRTDLDIARVNSWLRMAISLAWMVGPALSFILVAEFGFKVAFICAAALGFLNLLLWHIVVPRDFKAIAKEKKPTDADPINWGLVIAAIICLGFAITNILFVYAMPLFFVKETGLPGSTPGISLTVKCLTEIFMIFAAVRLAEKIGVRTVLLLAALLGAISMILFSQVTSLWHVVTISVLEGTYYGLFAGLSITFVQSFAPDKPGRATAVYMNSLFAGGLIGSVGMGLIASAADFKTVLYVAAGVSLSAFVVLLATLKVNPQQAEQQT